LLREMITAVGSRIGENDIRNGSPRDEAVAREILLSLSPEDQDAMVLYYLEGISAADIERNLGLTVGYVDKLKSSTKTRFFAERHKTGDHGAPGA